MDNEFLSRTNLLLGAETLRRLEDARVAIFGLGGVGGWCAEALARSGIGNMMIVDFDTVQESNINRQIIALESTVGQAKVEAFSRRLKDINPQISLDERKVFYSEQNASEFELEKFDYVIDAIDSLDSKVALIRHVLSLEGVKLYSSMGAALKKDIFAISASNFKKVQGDGLARALRQRFKKSGGIPEKPFTCVWSAEKLQNQVAQEGGRGKRAMGSIMHITAAFGLALANLVINDMASRV